MAANGDESESSEDLDYQPPNEDDDNDSSGGSGSEQEVKDGSGNDDSDEQTDTKVVVTSRKRKGKLEDCDGDDDEDEDDDAKGHSKGGKGKKQKLDINIKPPKRPITSYSWFMKQESHNFKGMNFREVCSLLASRWKTMTELDKKPYVDKSSVDRARYEKEMQAFLNSRDGKMYQMMKQKAKLNPSKTGKKTQGVNKEKGQKKKADKGSEQISKNDVGTVSNQLDSSGPVDPLNIPIFTDRFIEFNRKRDMKLRQLRRAATEVEAENAQLLSHMKALNAMIGRSEQDAVRLMAHSDSLSDQMTHLKQAVIQKIQSVPAYLSNAALCNFVEKSSAALEADEFMAELNSLVKSPAVELTLRSALKAALKKVPYPADGS